MSLFKQSLCYFLLCPSTLSTSTVAFPSPNAHSHIHNSHEVNAAIPEFIPSSNYGIAGGIDLRILPLGASMTIGHGSSHGNAYRENLRDLMPGNRVTYIGSKEEGNMTNNACECHSGFPIGPLIEKAQVMVPLKPNVVLVIGGTNDLLHDMNVKHAPEVMGKLIDNLTTHLPEATFVVAKLPPFGNSFIDKKRPPFNAGLDPVIEKRQKEGKRVLLVDPAVPLELISKKDFIHPNDVGYRMYAEKFYLALVEAGLRGWIKPLDEQVALDKYGGGITDRLSDEFMKGKQATTKLVGKSNANVPFIFGVLLCFFAYWALKKALTSSALRLRFGGGRVGI